MPSLSDLLYGLRNLATNKQRPSEIADAVNSLNAATAILAGDVGANKVRARTVGVIGDSRLANSYITPVPGAGTKSAGFQNQMAGTWLRALSGQRIDILPQHQLAVSGSTTTQVLTQANAMAALAVKPDICLINGGTNDFASAPTLAGANLAFTNITSAALILQSAGIVPVIEVDTPRTTASWSANAGVVSAQYNRRLRVWCSQNNIMLSDCEAQYIIPATGEPATSYNVADGIHSASTGSCIRALSFLRTIEPLLGKHTWGAASPRDSYDATINPYGNMLANAIFSGTGGIHTGTGASGTVPTSWMNRVISGTMTAVTSKLAPATAEDIGERLQVVINWTVAGEHRIQPNGGVGGGMPAPAGIVAGDLMYAEVDIEITALSGQIKALQLQLFDFDGTNTISTVFDMKTNLWPGNPLPLVPLVAANGAGNSAATLKLRLRTPPMVYADGATPTQLNWRLTSEGEAGAAMTYIASKPQLREFLS